MTSWDSSVIPGKAGIQIAVFHCGKESVRGRGSLGLCPRLADEIEGEANGIAFLNPKLETLNLKLS